jgi:ubiquinone/menaquinone biosynthesis C-methylase UbiE
MNYGYAHLTPEEAPTEQEDSESPDRHAIQMYRHVTRAVNLHGFRVLEVGCGRGGGASYTMRRFAPKSLTGLDFSENAIRLCKKNHGMEGLTFLVGDAEKLPFSDETFDAVLSVESSHCYGSMPDFFASVRRVLRPHGHLLLADFRSCLGLDELRRYIFQSGLKLIEEKNITANVLRSLDLEHERKVRHILSIVPAELQSIFEEFAGLKGTPMYQAFRQGDSKYLSYVLQKA